MQRIASVLVTSVVAGFFLTGCPDKKVEKEEPAAAPEQERAAPGDKADDDKADDDKADDDKADDDKADDEHGDEPEEHADHPKDDRPLKKRRLPPNDQGSAE